MTEAVFSCENKYQNLIAELDEAVKDQQKAVDEYYDGIMDPYNEGWHDTFVDAAKLARSLKEEHTCPNHDQQLLTGEDLKKFILSFVKERLDHEVITSNNHVIPAYAEGRIAAWEQWVLDIEHGTYDPETDTIEYDIPAAIEFLAAHSDNLIVGDNTEEEKAWLKKLLEPYKKMRAIEAGAKLAQKPKPSMWYALWKLLRG